MTPTARSRVRFSTLAALGAALACNTPHDEKSSAIAAIASESIAVRAAPPAPSVMPSAAPEKPAIRRPTGPTDLLVSTDRRAKVESAHPAARGFLTSAELEDKLYEMQLRRGKDADAVKAMDGLAAGKWVLFTGNIGNVTPTGFELPIRYTPKDPNDEMGITNVWFPVKFSSIEGYDGAAYRAGELAVVLAKYEGRQNATPGFDVVLLGQWFEPE